MLFKAYLPARVQQGAETAIGFVIVALAVWLLVRWRRGAFHVHVHDHGTSRHVHVHDHSTAAEHAHRHSVRARSPLQAYGIGLVHGMGGSAGVGILLLAAIHNHLVAVLALALFAFFTAVSMALLSTGFGLTLSSEPVRRSFNRIAPALGRQAWSSASGTPSARSRLRPTSSRPALVHEQAAGFALDALDARELRAFEHHLVTCPGCEDELEPLRLAAAALAFAGELPPPRPDLRRRILNVDGVRAPAQAACAPLRLGGGGRRGLCGRRLRAPRGDRRLDGRCAAAHTRIRCAEPRAR